MSESEPIDVTKDPRISDIKYRSRHYPYEKVVEDSLDDPFATNIASIIKEDFIDDCKMILFETVIHIILMGIEKGILTDTATGARPSDDLIARTAALCFARIVHDHFPHYVYFTPLPAEEADQFTFGQHTFASGMTAVTITSGLPFLAFCDPNDALLVRLALPNSRTEST